MGWAPVAALLFSVACATVPPPAPETVNWPPLPQPARVQRVGEIRHEVDLGIQRGWWGRVVDTVLGHRQESLLTRPMGIECLEDGRLLVTDPGARRVLLLDPLHHRIQRIPSDDHLSLPSPIDAALDGHGHLLVSDSVLGQVLRFDLKGRSLGELGSGGLLDRPTGIAVDTERDRIYVADTTRHQVVVFGPDGQVVRVIGGRGAKAGEFNFPTHLALDRHGNLYVTDAMNFRIQILDPAGRSLAVIGRLGDGPGTFSKPKGVAVDSLDHLLVVDALFDNVQVLARTGAPLLAFAHSGSDAASLWLPSGIAIDAHDRVYVADTYNHRIQIYQLLPEAQP
ncbi:MAG: 6-bladed beta-propeller [Deltaproteobacteria bacterium]|nr:6-bladed beta-propeller [Deltaproteobacteria bacterium]NCS73543.1 6-bladed beta-propeller [Deltaproteobacteria bacterium]OIP64584.1 MAG: hypothetical protein AUK30_06460 [Nitrospirae bacterium CG2_30_70_394]